MPKSLTVWITINCGKLRKRWEYQTTCLLRNLYAGQEATVRTGHGKQQTGSKQEKEYVKIVYCHPAYLTYMQSTSGESNGNPLQYSCLENPMDGGAWWATVHGVARSRTWLSDFTFIFHFHALEKEMATHSSVLAWRIPGTQEPGRLLSMGSHRIGHDWSDLAAAAGTEYKGINKNNPLWELL